MVLKRKDSAEYFPIILFMSFTKAQKPKKLRYNISFIEESFERFLYIVFFHNIYISLYFFMYQNILLL